MNRDERPYVEERDTGQIRMVYATECTCRQFRPVAVLCEGAVRYACRDCGSLWVNEI